MQTGITCIIQLVGILQVDILEECRTYTSFSAYIPATKLKSCIVLLPKKTVVCVRDHRTDASLGQQVQLYFPGRERQEVPAFNDIEKQEISPIVQIVVKAVGFIEGDSGIHRMMVQRPFYTRILIGKNELCMVEVDLVCRSLFLIQHKTQPVIILRDGQGLGEKTFIPSPVIMPFDIFKCIIVPK